MARRSARAWSVQTMCLGIAPRRLLQQRLLAHLFPVGDAQSEIPQNVLMRNRLVMREPFVSCGDGGAFRIAQGVGLLRRRKQRLQNMNYGVELPGSELIEQLMGVLSISGHCVFPWNRSGRA